MLRYPEAAAAATNENCDDQEDSIEEFDSDDDMAVFSEKRRRHKNPLRAPRHRCQPKECLKRKKNYVATLKTMAAVNPWEASKRGKMQKLAPSGNRKREARRNPLPYENSKQ